MYVILPSNSPAPGFSNTSSSYTIPFRLNTPHAQKWRVGAVHIQIPLTFYNVESDETVTIEREDGQILVLSVEEGIYTTPKALFKMLFRCGVGNHIDLDWDSGLVVKLKDETARVKFSPNLRRLLGLSGALEDKSVMRFTLDRFDPWINHRVLLVLCDLVRPVRFNNEEKPILQTLALEQIDFGETYFKFFAPLDLLDVQGESHCTVSVRITDLDGKPIKFRSGNVVLGLSMHHGSR